MERDALELDTGEFGCLLMELGESGAEVLVLEQRCKVRRSTLERRAASDMEAAAPSMVRAFRWRAERLEFFCSESEWDI